MDTARYGEIARDERTAAILADLHTAVDQVARSGQVERWLDALATDGMRRWSANNRLIALLQLEERAQAQQRPELLDEVHMMSLRQWDSEHGRRVKKGEKAIWILAPRTRKLDEQADDGTRTTRTIVTGFSAVPVFNITQTEGPDLPAPPVRTATGTVRAGVLQGLRERVGAAGYSYQEREIDGTNPEKGTGTLGYTDPQHTHHRCRRPPGRPSEGHHHRPRTRPCARGTRRLLPGGIPSTPWPDGNRSRRRRLHHLPQARYRPRVQRRVLTGIHRRLDVAEGRRLPDGADHGRQGGRHHPGRPLARRRLHRRKPMSARIFIEKIVDPITGEQVTLRAGSEAELDELIAERFGITEAENLPTQESER